MRISWLVRKEASMKKSDAICGGLLFLCGGVIYLMIPGQIREVGTNSVGPRAFPTFLAVLLMLCSLGLAAQSLYACRSQKPGAAAQAPASEKQPREKLPGTLYALLFYGLLLMYAFSLQMLGYILASVVFLPLMLYMLNMRRPALYPLLIPIILGIYWVFQGFLHVRLP